VSRHLILHVIDKFGDRGSTTHGPSQLLLNLVRGGDSERFAFEIVGLRGEDAASAHLRGQGLSVHCLGRHRFDPRLPWDLLRSVRTRRPALLHLHGFGASNYGRWVGMKTGIPVLIHEHGINAAIPFYQRIADRVLHGFAAEAIAVSREVREYLVNVRLVPRDRIHIIHNGVDVVRFAPTTPEESARTRMEWGADADPTVGLVGRFHPVKGQEDFLRAAASVVRRVPNARFFLVGDGITRESLISLSRGLGLGDKVRFLGHRGDLPSLFPLFDVQVVASHREGIPLVLLEGMATGRAVVATEVGGIPEVVDAGESGLLVPPRDPAAMAEAVVRLLADRLLRDRLGKAAVQRIRESFALPAMVAGVEAVYERLLRTRLNAGKTVSRSKDLVDSQTAGRI
jgi:glycosyltransferase involved in cell wall biosynthesis